LIGLVSLAGLAWLHLAYMPDMMLARFGVTFLMWGVMMVAMMVPSAAPMIVMFARLKRDRLGQATAVFLAGYLVVWSAFAFVAAAGEMALRTTALVSGASARAIPVLGGALAIAAGLYQLTPLKHACLVRCRSPLGFLLGEWRDGLAGAFTMGLRHGLSCVGCCWALMVLLFVAGVMNLAWVAILAAFVLIEKLVPGGRLVSWAAGGALLLWGAWILIRALAPGA
jgi:predicted metal-binding membrane protein